MIQAPFLNKGDKIMIIAPSGVLKDKNAVSAAKHLIEKWGFDVVVGKHVEKQNGHFAGKDTERIEDFQNGLNNADIKAIWALRGGYGAIRIVDSLDFTLFKKSPKWLIGFSDITVFHLHLQSLGFQSIHGSMPVQLKNKSAIVERSFESIKDLLTGKFHNLRVNPQKENLNGEAKGVLIGGNLSLIEALIGSPSFSIDQDFILFVEEISEYQYKIDRMLRSIRRSAVMDNCKGLLFGQFSHIPDNDPNFEEPIAHTLKNVFKDLNIPIAFGLPCGHESENHALLLGGHIQLNVLPHTTEISYTL